MRKLIALAALAALFCSAAFAAPVYVPGQQGTIGNNVAATDQSGNAIRAIAPIVTLTDATGAAVGTAGSPLVTSSATGSSNTAPVSAGAATATNSNLIGCRYVSTLDTFATTNQGALSCDTRGNLGVLTKFGGASVADAVSFSSALSGVSNSASSPTGSPNPLAVYHYISNGTSLDTQRSIQGAAVNGSNGLGVTAVEEAGRTFSHINSNATTAIKSGKGFLHTVCVNTKGATANTATIYDNTAGSGTIIALLDTTANVGCQTYDAAFATGLTIVTATGTAADLTVTYR